ncbi:MAG: DNA cytosine methyltransferase [Candidatus Paceibacterota bacterium]
MKIVSLFSGAGGMDLGFKLAGHEIIWANENDPDCCETYKNNIGDHIVLADIEEVKSSQIPDSDIIIGGFPCQGFSRANLKRSKNDKRNQLYLEFVRILQEKKPKYFVAENVRGLLSLDGGQVINMIIDDFSKVGYNVKYKLFNTADYGVPQNRHRVIIIGCRKDLNENFIYNFPTPTHVENPNLFNNEKSWISIGKALKDIPEPEEDPDVVNHIYSKYKITNRDFTGHRKMNPDKPSPTVLARGNGGGGVVALQHPKNHRRLSVRESATIQTFPISFKFFGSMSSMYRQVGNAVPVLFAKKIAEEFLNIEEKH